VRILTSQFGEAEPSNGKRVTLRAELEL
jgi:hypothetical protein